MNETKMLSFEEWKEKFAFTNLPVTTSVYNHMLKTWFNAARQGTIPADRAVEIPEVAWWPDSAVGCQLAFDCVRAGNERSIIWAGDTPYIHRPDPQWAPKVGESCLLNIEGIAVEIIYSDAYTHLKRENMAQRDPTKIGKPWGEI